MPKAVIIDGIVHGDHPDKEMETFCGETYNTDNTRIAMAMNFEEDVVPHVLRKEEAEERCEECIQKGKKWATPDEEKTGN